MTTKTYKAFLNEMQNTSVPKAPTDGFKWRTFINWAKKHYDVTGPARPLPGESNPYMEQVYKTVSMPMENFYYFIEELKSQGWKEEKFRGGKAQLSSGQDLYLNYHIPKPTEPGKYIDKVEFFNIIGKKKAKPVTTSYYD
jgi:hypothetical protein